MNGELPNRLQEERLEAGCDEAGRGCLAGPVYAAAVILPAEHSIEGLNDSKSLSAGERKQLCGEIEDQAVAWAVEALTPSEIDTNNILKSSILAMHRSVDALELRPEYLLIDGNYFLDHETVPHRCIVRGDAKVGSIAAASILAKHYRDQYMIELNPDFPQYHWHSNKGYPTAQHRAAIQRYGPTEHHRRSFRLFPEGEQEEMF